MKLNQSVFHSTSEHTTSMPPWNLAETFFTSDTILKSQETADWERKTALSCSQLAICLSE